MLIVDAHRDIAYDALYFDRDYRRSVAETRRRDAELGFTETNGLATTGLPEAIAGDVAIVFATLFVEPASYVAWGSMDKIRSLPRDLYKTPQEAHDFALKQLEYYETITAESDQLVLITTQDDLDHVLSTWDSENPPEKRQQGLVILMEGADPVIEPAQFGDWYERGVRILGTSWTGTRYAGGTNAPGPLTDLGRALLDEMASYDAILDLSHMSEEACNAALDRYEGNIVATHALPRHFCDTDRHLTDDQLKSLAEHGGVMGIVLLNALWNKDADPAIPVTLDNIVEVVDYVCQLTGSSAHAGIGTDWYAGTGASGVPDGLDSYADLGKVGEALRKQGYSENDVKAILSGNMLRILRQTLP